MSKEYNIFKDWKEFDEEQFRLDTDTDEMTINEVISEALATLKTSYEFTEKDFRRVEKTALLGMYYQQNIINKQEEVLDKIKEEVEARIEYCKQHQSEDEWECCIEELQNIHKLLEKVYE